VGSLGVLTRKVTIYQLAFSGFLGMDIVALFPSILMVFIIFIFECIFEAYKYKLTLQIIKENISAALLYERLNGI
jgi:hypothetical protein